MAPLHPQPSLLFYLYPCSTQCLRSIPKSCPLRPRPNLKRLDPSHHSRSFATTSSLHAAPPRSDQQSMEIKQPARKSTKAQLKDADLDYAKGTMDLGLIDQIFIRPEWKKRPGWFGGWDSFRDRIDLEWHSLKKRTIGFLGLLYYNKWASKRRLPLAFRRRKLECKTLHRAMYTALASGDLPTLRLICADGLYQYHTAQVQRRVHTGGKPLLWELVKYNGPVRVVADTAAQMEIEGLAVRQCIVKIPSLQRLSEQVGEGSKTADAVRGDSKPGKVLREMETTEYMVMQKKIMHGKEGEWVLWGTVQPHKWQSKRLRHRIAGSF